MRIGFVILSLFYSVILLGNSPPVILSHEGNETVELSLPENSTLVSKILFQDTYGAGIDFVTVYHDLSDTDVGSGEIGRSHV